MLTLENDNLDFRNDSRDEETYADMSYIQEVELTGWFCMVIDFMWDNEEERCDQYIYSILCGGMVVPVSQ